MSIFGYFAKKRPEFRMSTTGADPDSLGIRWHGPVTSGVLSVQEAFHLEKRRLPGPNPVLNHVLPPSMNPTPRHPDQYPAEDPRVSSDPRLEAYRQSLGPRPRASYSTPEQYDPVLRAHLRMPPLPAD